MSSPNVPDWGGRGVAWSHKHSVIGVRCVCIDLEDRENIEKNNKPNHLSLCIGRGKGKRVENNGVSFGKLMEKRGSAKPQLLILYSQQRRKGIRDRSDRKEPIGNKKKALQSHMVVVLLPLSLMDDHSARLEHWWTTRLGYFSWVYLPEVIVSPNIVKMIGGQGEMRCEREARR